MFNSDNYELIDFGAGRRLERFAGRVIDRPCPAAERFRKATPERWEEVDARFEREGKGDGDGWTLYSEMPEAWTIHHGPFQMELRRSPVGHLGVFPEQASNWDWIAKQILNATETAGDSSPSPMKILNLFAYTGGSTLAAAAAGVVAGSTKATIASGVRSAGIKNAATGLKNGTIEAGNVVGGIGKAALGVGKIAGGAKKGVTGLQNVADGLKDIASGASKAAHGIKAATTNAKVTAAGVKKTITGAKLSKDAKAVEVVHVDAAANTVARGKRNAELSGLKDAPIRWIAEDAMKFVRRELKRGNGYDAIILDPPSYGHGRKGEIWQVEKDLPELLAICAELTADRRRFILLTCHTPGFDTRRLSAMLRETVADPRAKITASPLGIRASSGRTLPGGVVVRLATNTR